MAATTLVPPRAEPLSARTTASFALPRLWLRRIRVRRALAALHPVQIREAGLDPFRLRAEIIKPFWRE